jgi:peroxiredoxin
MNLEEIAQALDSARTQSGKGLAQLSAESPVLLVFLRHAGCAFCREALSDLGRARSAIEQTGTRMVLVDLGDSGSLERLLRSHGMSGVDRIPDPAKRLYRAFGLKPATFGQLFAPRVFWRGFQAAVLAGHGLARPTADAWQMPGVFLLHHGRITRRMRHRTAADRPDYLAFCAEPEPPGRPWRTVSATTNAQPK